MKLFFCTIYLKLPHEISQIVCIFTFQWMRFSFDEVCNLSQISPVKLVNLPAFSPFSGCALVLAGISKTIFSYVFYDCYDFYDYCQFHLLLLFIKKCI